MDPVPETDLDPVILLIELEERMKSLILCIFLLILSCVWYDSSSVADRGSLCF
jgi:hypothetical protein